MQPSSVPQKHNRIGAALRLRQVALCGTLVLVGLSAYLAILVPTRTAWKPIWQPLLVARFLTAAAALTVVLTYRLRGRSISSAEANTVSYSTYFKLAFVGCLLSFAIVIQGLHGESIETAATQLQAVAWLMTTGLAWIARRNNHPQQAKQWFARSVAMTITAVLLPLLWFCPRLQPDGDGLRKGIVVFLAFLSADVFLNLREITTKRSRSNVLS